MSKLKISVLMPVYNNRKYLKTSIESILNQTFEEFEFVIIDDGSTDGSSRVIKSYQLKDKRIIVIRNKHNIGTSRSLNKGLSVAKGDYIVRMDADDWSYPERLRIQYEYMKSHPRIGVSGGSIEVCDQNLKVVNRRRYPLDDNGARKIIFCYSPFAHPATIWDTKKMKMIGGYNEKIPLSQDCELYFKIGRFVEFGNVDATLIKLRTHKSSSSVSKNGLQEQYAIYSRIKAIMEYGYSVSLVDKLCILGRIVAMIVVPTKIKFWLFNFLRREA